MARRPRFSNRFFASLRWVPVLVYFVTKYLLFGNEMTWLQWSTLLAAVLLAELAIWLYQRKHQAHGTDQAG